MTSEPASSTSPLKDPVIQAELAAIAGLALTGPLTAAPLQREANELDDAGWARAAYLAQWMAGPAANETDPPTDATEPDANALALADTAAPEPTAEDSSAASPSPEPTLEATTLAANDPAAKGTETETETETKPEPAPERDYSPAELFSAYAPSVVSIKVGHHGFSSGGTGFIIDDRGTIATNHHVIDEASEVLIKTLDGIEVDRVELLASDPEVDLALLRVDPAKLGDKAGPVTLGDSESVEVGEPVSVIGNPLGLEHTLTNGIVSARRVYEGKRYIQMSAPISPGNSGGPVFDHHARVIAVSVATMFGGQNLNLAVPVSQLQAMIADDYPNRRSFGASSW